MEIKYADEYAEELAGYFPMIEEKELKKMVKVLSRKLTCYMKVWYRGFSVRSKNSLAEEGKMQSFIVARIFGRYHLKNMQGAAKNANAGRYGTMKGYTKKKNT